MKRLIVRILLIAAVVEIAYLAVANVALNLPGTQAYLNQLRPDRFAIRWDRAWSWYPFRVHATGLSANGQSWSQQWQVSAPAARASFYILPLLWKTVHVRGLDSGEIDVRFRPRPRPDRDDKDLRRFYPPIEGRDPNAPAEAPPVRRPGWQVIVEIAEIAGQNSFWIWGTKGTVVGEGRATVIRETHGGPIAIVGGEADAALESLTVDGQQVSDRGAAKGTFGFAPFVPRDHRGLKKLAFMSVDVEMDLPVDSLDFLDFYLRRATGMTLGGEGELKGRIAFDKGNLLTGTDLKISAKDLSVAEMPYSVSGAGEVDIAVAAADPDAIEAVLRFDTLGAFHEPDHEKLFAGENLAVTVERSAYVLPEDGESMRPRRVAVDIPSMTVPDLKAYQRYLPDKWQVQVLGGTGSLEGRAEMSESSLAVDLMLRSENAQIDFKGDAFETDLALGAKATGQAPGATAEVDFSGSYLSLDDSRVKGRRGDNSAPWRARLAVSVGTAEIELPETTGPGPAGFWELSRERDFKALLATLDGRLQADLSISDLNWANVLFKNPYALALYNAAEIEADVTVRSGWLAEGSNLKMQPQSFRIEVLDYVAEGDGGFDVTVDKGGEEPDFRLDARLADASLRLQDEKDAVVDRMTLDVTATAKGIPRKGGGTVTTVDVSIPSAKINDLSAYNAYLPKGSPLRITGGSADLSAKVNLQPNTAGGFVRAHASRVDASMDGQPISGAMAVDIAIKGGAVDQRTFDISGSSLTLDRVRFAGAAQGNWSGRIDLGKAKVVWRKPVNLSVDAAVRMTDTRPLVAIFAAHRKTHAWLEKILTLKDVRGNATIRVEPNAFVVPYASARSDMIEIGAKGVVREHDRQGMFYARYGKLAGILEVDNDRRKFGLIGATRKFEDYVPGAKLPGLHGSGAPAGEKKGPFSIFRRN